MGLHFLENIVILFSGRSRPHDKVGGGMLSEQLTLRFSLVLPDKCSTTTQKEIMATALVQDHSILYTDTYIYTY